MGSFGIYALVVTFIFVIYYVVIICLDLFGAKDGKKESAEIIHTNTPVNNAEDASAVSPVRISETGEGTYQIERPGEETPETYGNMEGNISSGINGEVLKSSQSVPTPLTVEDIAAADAEELARQAKAKADSVNQNFNSVSPDIQGAMYVEEFVEDYTDALLKARRDDEQAEQFSF